MRLATIDIGTNTSSLLVAKADGSSLCRLHVSEQFVRLGEGVDASGRIGREAQERLLETLRDQVGIARAHGAGPIVIGATSAMRDAENRTAVMTRIRETLGLSVELLTGDEEAVWSFAAAQAAFDDRTGDCLVVDIGGGSTELITGPAAPTTPRYLLAETDRTSLDVGCVRLTERCFPRLPPPRAAVSEATNIIDAALDSAQSFVNPGMPLLGTAGTATALALVHAGPESTLATLPDDALVLSAEAVRNWRDRLLALSVDDILALHPEAMPGRADVFPVGILLLDRIMQRYRLDPLRVSPYELRYGLALRHCAIQTS